MSEPYDRTEDDDIDAHESVQKECRRIFIERKQQYGDHRKKPIEYIDMSLGVKSYRIFTDIKDGKDIKRDTALDMINYLTMLLTHPKYRG